MLSLLRFQTAALPTARRLSTTSIRGFHASPLAYIKVGDLVPNVQLREDTPGQKVSIAEELKGIKKALILGVPGAFSPACSAAHIAKYIKAKVDVPTYVVAINDPFVTKAWKDSLTSSDDKTFRFLADSTSEFTDAVGMKFDATAIFGGPRSKRYALIVEDGKVSKMFAEPDNTGVSVTSADNILPELK
ncbi:Redoxin [Choiromyces venosus 120613-1]|uniref:Redoxin n=1 Tax=Choiromyces venosus 120613-1 TaxID=1336337 RepID=A0A3N4JRL5_9PEZI|nr:Redoxin [Choiromyces venosus 120613-1]